MADQLRSLRDQLQADLQASNVAKCQQLLVQAKIGMIHLGAYTPDPKQVDTETLLASRDILEMGAYVSVRVKDIASFERYIAQLHPYYHDLSAVLPASNQMYPLIGLNLLRLLSQNRLSDFHTALETIDPQQLQANSYIKQAVDLEQFLMEGSYNKVWSSRNTVQGEEFLFFYDSLISTVRNEIASCSEKAYDSLPLQDAATLLFLNNSKDLLAFAQKRNWKINPAEQVIYFAADDKDAVEIPQEQIITHTLAYARELERIV
ncbi:COP9 signalosome [Gongronella butleri]|nr:COP9 signalosome [Gongronella butleri]